MIKILNISCVLATAFAVSCMTSMAGGQAPAAARGAVLGTLRSLGALARAAGPLLAAAGMPTNLILDNRINVIVIKITATGNLIAKNPY